MNWHLNCQVHSHMINHMNNYKHFAPVPLEKSSRLMNHGPTVLVSARHAGIQNAMAAAWACVLDYGSSTKVTVVLDKSTFTRRLIESSGYFVLQLPTRAMASLTHALGLSLIHI